MPTKTKNVDEWWSRSWLIQKFVCITAYVNPEASKLEEATTGGVQ